MDIAQLGLKVDSSDVKKARDDLGRFTKSADEAGTATGNLGRKSEGITASVKGMAVQIAAAAGGMAALTKAFGAAEQYTNMQNRMLALGASHESAAAQIQQLGDIAKRTRSPLQATSELYSRLSLTSDSLGASQQDLMQFTETVGLALAASGTSAGQASGALTQLSQAMAGGVVRAEEFNSMIEGAPGLLMAVANGMDGVNGDLGKLRQMMLDGELTSEAFFKSLLSQNAALQKSFENTAPTIASAFGVLSDQITIFIGEADQASGITSSIAGAVLSMADNLEVLLPVVGSVALAVGAMVAPFALAATAIGGAAFYVLTNWESVRDRFPRITGAMKTAFASVSDTIRGLEPVARATVDAVKAAFESASQAMQDLAPTAEAALATVRSLISGDWSEAWSSAKSIVDEFQNWWTGLNFKLPDNAAKVFDDFFGNFYNSVEQFFAPMAQTLQDAWANIDPILSNLNDIGTKLSALFSDEVKSGNNIFSQIGGFVGTMAGLAGAGVVLFLEGLSEGVKALTGAVSSALSGDFDGAVNSIIGFFEWIRDEVNASIFSDALSSVRAFGSDLVDALKDAGRLALDAALNIGVEIINGISVGIDRKFQELKDKITGLGVYLPEWLKDMLGIASPSKVFAEIGEWTVDGLVVGMDDREDALRTRAETLGKTMGQGIKDGLDPVLRTVFDGLARGDIGSIGSGLLDMARGSFSDLLQGSFAKGGGGLGNVWKSITSGFTGIGATFSAASGAAGGGLSGLLSGAGAALSGLLPGIGTAMAVFELVQGVIGTTTKLTNALEGTLDLTGLARGTEYDIKQNDNMFGSSTEKNSEEIFGSWAGLIAQDLDQEFRDMVQNTRDGIRSLGLDINEAFTYDFDVQFDESLPHEQLMERLRGELSQANDELLRTSLAAAGLARDGETGAQTLVALNDSLRTANASLRLLDQTLFDVSAIGAGAARELVETSGGLDAFASKTSFVFENFLTQGEQDARALQIATENLNSTFGDLQFAIPATRAEFVALMDAQDLATAAGRNTYSALLDVAESFVTAEEMAAKLAESADDAGDSLNNAADAARELAAIERERTGLVSQVYRLLGAENALRQIQLNSLDESNRALQEHIFLLEDQQEALRNALDAARDTLQIARDALSEAEDAARRAFGAEADRITAAYDKQIEAAEAIEAALDTAAQNLRDAFEAEKDSVRDAYAAQIEAIQTEQLAARERAGLEADAVRDRVSLLRDMGDLLDNALFARLGMDTAGQAMQLRDATAFLRAAVQSGGTDDRDGLERALGVVADPSKALFDSFADYQQSFNVNTNLIEELGKLNGQSLSVEERTLREIEDQIDVLEDGFSDQITALEKARDAQIAALDAQRDAILGLDTSILSVEAAIAAFDAAQARAAEAALDAGVDNVGQVVGALEIARDAQLAALDSQLNALLGINTSILSMADAIANLQIAQDVADAAEAAAEAAEAAVEKGAGGGVAVGMSSAEKRLMQILAGLDGGGDAAALEAAAFGYFSEDNMNAILSDSAQALLTGVAADVAGVYDDILGRNADVAGLEYYIGQIVDNGLTLDEISADMAGSVEKLTLLIPGFSTTVSDAIHGIDAAANVAVGAANTSAVAAANSASASATAIAAADQALAAAQAAAASASAAASAASRQTVRTGGMYDTIVGENGQTYGEYLAGVPSYATGTDYHRGGPAILHENEMVNLPRGTGVSTASEVAANAAERRRSNELLEEANLRNRDMQIEIKRMRRILSEWNNVGQPGFKEGVTVATETA